MAPGRKSLRRLQIGLEQAPGTTVAPTVIMRWDNAVIADLRTVQEPAEQMGIVGGVDRTVVTQLFANCVVPDQPISYEQIPYVLNMAFGGITTAGTTATTTDSASVFAFPIPVTTSAPQSTYTFQGGDDHEVELMPYAYCTKIKLSGKGGDTLKLGATFEGRFVTTNAGSAFNTNAVLAPYIEDIPFSKGKLYIDAVTSTAGTTQITAQLVSAELNLTQNYIPKYTADGNLFFTFAMYIDQMVTGKLTFEHDAAVDGGSGAKLDWRAQNPKMIRLMWTGTNFGWATTSATYAQRAFVVDLPIKWKTISALSDDKGNDLVVAEFRSRYDPANSTAGNGKMTVALARFGTTGGTTNGCLF